MEDDEAPLGEPASSSQGPVDAARVLALLDEVNLRGARLAFQQGDEEALVEQVAARLDIDSDEWLLRFIKNLVQVAKAEAELEGRFDGSMTTPGAQAIRDAVEYQMKEGHRKKGHAEQEALKLVKAAPPKVCVQRRRTRKATKFGSSAEEEEEIVMSVLVQELEVVGAPVLEKIQKVANKRRASDALKGKYRISSIRRYLAYWQKFRAWVQATSGQKTPRHAHQLVDYLYAREEEGMGPSLPLAIWKGVSWFEKVAQIPEGERLSDDEFLGMVVKELLQKLEGKAPLVKRAPRMLSAFMGPMEDVVMDEDQHWAVRMAAWAKLVKVWASLRFDDLANLRMKEVKVYDGQLSGVMRRTKTTGAGKRVRELPIHVSADAWVKHPEWFTVGWDVVKHVRPRERDFVIPDGMTVCGLRATEKLKYADAVAMSYDLMARLKCENGEKLIPDQWERFWTEHSERSTLSSALAAIGVPKDERDALGRWKPEGSNQYVRTYNAVVKRLQGKYAEQVRLNQGYSMFDEGAVLEELKDWLVNHWGSNKEEANAAVESWKPRVKGAVPFISLKGRKEMEGDSAKVEPGDQSTTDEDELEPKRKMARVSEERKEGYLVVRNRLRKGTLHLATKDGCWMARTRKFKNYLEFDQIPAEDLFTSRCKLCWRPQRDGDSSSSSSGTEEELEVEFKPMTPKGVQGESDNESQVLWSEAGELALTAR